MVVTLLPVSFLVSTQGGRDTPKGRSEEEVYNPPHGFDHDHDDSGGYGGWRCWGYPFGHGVFPGWFGGIGP